MLANDRLRRRQGQTPSAVVHGAHARRIAALASAFAVAAALLSPTPAPAADAFSALKGRWSGGGSASFAGGQTEKLRCSANYSGGGASLAIHLKCASSSAQINLSGNLQSNGNRVSGGWSESGFGMSGSASGSKTGSGVRLRISGGAQGSLSLSVAGNRHSISLASSGTLTGVSVSMRRR